MTGTASQDHQTCEASNTGCAVRCKQHAKHTLPGHRKCRPTSAVHVGCFTDMLLVVHYASTPSPYLQDARQRLRAAVCSKAALLALDLRDLNILWSGAPCALSNPLILCFDTGLTGYATPCQPCTPHLQDACQQCLLAGRVRPPCLHIFFIDIFVYLFYLFYLFLLEI